MRQLDLKQLAAKVSVEHGIRVDPDDPIMAVVTLNRLVLELATNEIVEEVRVALREFEHATESVQVRAGTLLAQGVRDGVSLIRQEVKNISSRSTQTRVGTGNAVCEKQDARFWFAIGLLAGILLFGSGVWLGTMLR